MLTFASISFLIAVLTVIFYSNRKDFAPGRSARMIQLYCQEHKDDCSGCPHNQPGSHICEAEMEDI